MKNLLLLFLVVATLFTCKKKEDPKEEETTTTTTGSTTSPQFGAYCIYESQNGKKVILKCVSTQEEAQKESQKYRDQGRSVSSAGKATCSDC